MYSLSESISMIVELRRLGQIHLERSLSLNHRTLGWLRVRTLVL
jgi:hypothetical protein